MERRLFSALYPTPLFVNFVGFVFISFGCGYAALGNQ